MLPNIFITKHNITLSKIQLTTPKDNFNYKPENDTAYAKLEQRQTLACRLDANITINIGDKTITTYYSTPWYMQGLNSYKKSININDIIAIENTKNLLCRNLNIEKIYQSKMLETLTINPKEFRDKLLEGFILSLANDLQFYRDYPDFENYCSDFGYNSDSRKELQNFLNMRKSVKAIIKKLPTNIYNDLILVTEEEDDNQSAN